MNPGIFYLYEYENNTRRRNVGFIKVSRRYQTCILQIHVRGISVGNGAPLELYAFYRDSEAMTGTQIATLTCFGKSVSARLPISERSFPEGRPLSEMDGFLIKLPGDRTPVFWMASAFFFPVDINTLRFPSASEEEPAGTTTPFPEEPESSEPASQPEIPEEPEASEPAPLPERPEETEASEPAPLPERPEEPEASEPAPLPEIPEKPEADKPESQAEPGPESAAEDRSESIPDLTETGVSAMPAPVFEKAGTEHSFSLCLNNSKADRTQDCEEVPVQGTCEGRPKEKKARKIQRSDISVLPRRFWFLANNSFLLHGYHNYNHLLLAEEEGRLWLGVPGIYDPREARAADLFGFPQFTRQYTDILDLEQEERSDSGDFGYWCRCVGAGKLK